MTSKEMCLRKCFENDRLEMILLAVFASCAIILSLSTLPAESLEFPPTAPGNLRVNLEVPWTGLMAGESIQYEFVLENLSDEPVPVAFPQKELGFGWPNGGQAFLEGRPKIEEAELSVERAVWPPKTEYGGEMEDVGYLPPGHRVRWNQNRLQSWKFGIFTTGLQEEIQAHWLIGPREWISSDPVKYEASMEAYHSRERLFTVPWVDQRSGTNMDAAFYRVALFGRQFLFYERNRVTELQNDSEIAHRILESGEVIEIEISEAGGEKKLYCHLGHGLISSKPFPDDPAEYLYPSPEPIPPAELAALRKSRPSVKRSSKKRLVERRSEQVGDAGVTRTYRRNPLLVILFVLVFVTAVLLLRVWFRRRRV